MDRNKHGGGLLFYINRNIPCKVINDEIIPSYIEMIKFEFLEIQKFKNSKMALYWSLQIIIPKGKLFS